MNSSVSHFRSGRLTERSGAVNLKDSLVARLVDSSSARAWMVVAAAAIVCAVATQYVVSHFAMTTDTYALLSSKLPWRVRQAAFNRAFPQEDSSLVVVVDGRTPELSEGAAARLAAGLSFGAHGT